MANNKDEWWFAFIAVVTACLLWISGFYAGIHYGRYTERSEHALQYQNTTKE